MIRKVWRDELSPRVLQLGFCGLENAVGVGASSAGRGRGAGDAGVLGDGCTGTGGALRGHWGDRLEKWQGKVRGEQGTRCKGRGRHGSTLFRTGLMIDYWQNWQYFSRPLSGNAAAIQMIMYRAQFMMSQHRNTQSTSLMLSVKCRAFNQ